MCVCVRVRVCFHYSDDIIDQLSEPVKLKNHYNVDEPRPSVYIPTYPFPTSIYRLVLTTNYYSLSLFHSGWLRFAHSSMSITNCWKQNKKTERDRDLWKSPIGKLDRFVIVKPLLVLFFYLSPYWSIDKWLLIDRYTHLSRWINIVEWVPPLLHGVCVCVYGPETIKVESNKFNRKKKWEAFQ